MDNILEKIERLSALAAQRRDPRPMDVAGVMADIRGLEIEDEALSLPLGFLSGGAAAAAAAAVAVSVLAVSGWNDLSSPMLSIDALLDISEVWL